MNIDVSESPAPVSRAGCHPKCGQPNLMVTDRVTWGAFYDDWCSAACKRYRLPPIEAPAEASVNSFVIHCQSAQPKPCCRVAGLSGGRSHYSDCKRAVVTVPQGGSITTPWISLKPAQPKVAAMVEPVPLNQCDEACGRTGPLRYLTNRLRRLCDPCYLSLEKDQARRMAFYVVPSIDKIRSAPSKPGPLPVVEDLWTLLGEDLR